MKILGERLKQLRKEKGLSLLEMEKATGLTKSAISNYENDFRTPSLEALDTLTDFFNVETDYLIGKTDIRNPYTLHGIYDAGQKDALQQIQQKMRVVPIYSGISCGTGRWVDETPEDYVGIPQSMLASGDYFANPADGDSMEPRIHQGDFVVFQQTPEVDSGEIGAFSLNGEYYCKRFRRLEDGSVWLFSENHRYDPIHVKPYDEFRILGKYKMRITKD